LFEKSPKTHQAMKPFLVCLFALSLISTVEAKKKGGGNGQAQKEQQEKQKEKAEREKRRDAVKDVMDAKDKNNDGSLSKEEYLAGEADVDAATATFDQFNKNKDRFLSKSELAASLGL
jgi:hypothetical protein